jgi:hypothetical protein
VLSSADPHHFDANPNPACNFDADPEPACHFDVDADSLSYLILKVVE